ncbi:MAG TPA: TraB/GumN family protein, partial [Flavisolibacter sp.]
MKKIFWLTILAAFGLTGAAQTTNNTLLWRITGKNTTKPSYLFGTIHMICATDIQLSDSLKIAIHNADKVYLELDMDNMFEMLGALGKMKMRNDTTLSDLLTKEEYQKVKEYFNKKGGLIPFSMLETYKPMLAASTLMEQNMDCDNMIVMEQLVMEEANKSNTEIKGLESVNFQMSIFDSIPYKLQAKQLLKYVEDEGKGESSGSKELEALTKAYRNQELKKLEDLINSDQSLGGFNDIL